MTPEEIIALVRQARQQALVGRGPAGNCDAVAAHVRSRLFLAGVGVSYVYGQILGPGHPNDGAGHQWLETAGRMVIDPTASQFPDAWGRPMPEVYYGPRPAWYVERGRYAPLV